ncbi:MAG: DUF2723 domain-containing protein [Dysgonamonadaceae bacterium]|jgi:hypothetical protein|nr:DUF2723 domain-containing protein [Dysgonamonadaceae bacterium]
MKTFKLANNILGWIVFAIAAATFLMTIEPTGSFWDCGEFIASAYKLEVGHPPGNPIFMMVANLFTQLTSDTSMKAAMVNSMSAIFSALTILFLFWTITHLARKILFPDANKAMSLAQMIAILGCGAVGALAYTWSDTFWFSAVEGEVYAFSSLMTALVFWVILKWEDVAGEPHSDRWLILIAYLMGVSIAVHLLNLLCIPAIVLVYYYKKYPRPTLKGSLAALLISFVVVGVMLYGIIQGVVKVAGWFELLFVNGLGLPYNTGVGFYIFAVFAVLAWGIWETMREKYHSGRAKTGFLLSIALLGIPFIGSHPMVGIVILAVVSIFVFNAKKLNPAALNSILVGLFVITIGYSSYALIMIRSAANTPMDQNSPEDIFTLREYLSREQYGETPLLYGQTFVAQVKRVRDGNLLAPATKDSGPVWTQIAKSDANENDRYFVSRRKESYVYPEELCTIFPRMYSKEHTEAYKQWTNFKGKRVRYREVEGGAYSVMIVPTFMENLKFFFSYQVNFMYWRYFLWNFAGRQNEIQGYGEVANGNWISGIKFLDERRLGSQDNLPDFIAKNKGHNKFYLLPLLLGILGVIFQIYSGKKGTQDFWVVFLLFFMTGLAIVIYLNQTPNQPRERDYAYAGSFYAFCIWIGLGVGLIEKWLRKYLKLPGLPAAIAASALCLLVPIQMVSQTWDDHDRSKRYLMHDFGYNYLSTCEPNAVIFTMGDNDTFPLWYAQEVEGYRTDVRVCNLSYLQTDWYIDQMKRRAYESEPLPISWKRAEYMQGKHDIAFILDPSEKPQDMAHALARIKSDDNRVKKVGDYPPMDNIRSNLLYIPVDTAAAIRSGVVKPEQAGWLEDKIYIYLGPRYNANREVVTPQKQALAKQEMMILDMLRNNEGWSRPFYFATTVGSDQYIRMENYFRQDGVAYRIVPYDVTTGGRNIDTDIFYENLMHKYRWGNLEKPGLYIDSNSMRMARMFRAMFGTLGSRLIAEGKKDKAIEAMDYAVKSIPDYNVPYDFYSMSEIASTYLLAGDTAKARAIINTLSETVGKELDWYSRLNDRNYMDMYRDIRNDLYAMGQFLQFYRSIDTEKYEVMLNDYNRFGERFESASKSANK